MATKEETIASILYKSLDYIYCDNCRFSSEVSEDDVVYHGCEDCHRKMMGWELSLAEAKRIASVIVEETKDQ